MNATYLGKLIKALRKQEQMKQAELASKLGVSISAISKWETGKNLPDTDVIKELSQIFNIPVDDLYHTEETLFRLETSDNDSPKNTEITPKTNKHKYLPYVIITTILILISIVGIVLYTYNQKDHTNARPVASRMIEEEPFGQMHEMAIVYEGDLDIISNPTTAYMRQIYTDWCNDTNVPSTITTMKVSFYDIEEDALQWKEPQKSTYFFR